MTTSAMRRKTDSLIEFCDFMLADKKKRSEIMKRRDEEHKAFMKKVDEEIASLDRTLELVRGAISGRM